MTLLLIIIAKGNGAFFCDLAFRFGCCLYICIAALGLSMTHNCDRKALQLTSPRGNWDRVPKERLVALLRVAFGSRIAAIVWYFVLSVDLRRPCAQI